MITTRTAIAWAFLACLAVTLVVMALTHDPVMEDLGRRIVHERLVSGPITESNAWRYES